ncbi:hypothetical protein GCM10025789_22180 [Tessaracoccus lubricantis]|uniref:DUF2383 domain-containing protein n=1 Tax=Tessaracoccus lubricantis TaxID=545543 RepID=A0ABP9FI88_9ACTN
MYLKTYLRDHHSGSVAGVDGFHRVAEYHSDPEVRTAVARIAQDIEKAQDELEAIMKRFGAKPNAAKDLMAKAGEKVTRMKMNREVTKRSPLSDVVELEALMDAVHAQSRGWQILLQIDGDAGLDRGQLTDLFARARSHETELEELWLKQAPKLLLDDESPQ